MTIKGFKKKASSIIDHTPPKITHKKRSGRQLVFLLFCLSLITIIATTIVVSIAGADPADDITSREADAESVRGDIAALNAELELKVENYNFANYELDRIETSISENEQQLKETAVVLDDTQARLDKRITSIYKSGSTDIVDVLMDTSDVTEFLTTYDMLTKVGEQDKSDVDQVKMLKDKIETAQVELAADQVKQGELLNQLESEKADIESGLTERQQMLAGIEDEIATIREQEAAEQARQQAAAVAVNNGGSSGGGSSSSGGGGGSFDPPPISNTGDAVSIAMQYLGVPYVWGGASASGVDCSGLVMVVYGALGYSLPHSAAAQMGYGTNISYDQLAPGDLVFFGYGSGISHVGIYIGGGSMIHAPFEGQVVSIAPVSYGGSFAGATRL